MRDVHNNIKAIRTISPIALGTTGTGKTGKPVDTLGYLGVELVLSYGAITATNATVIPVIKHGDATGTMTSVADADLLGTEAAAGISATSARASGTSKNVTKRIGYIGEKRYVSASLVNTVSAGIVAGADVILTRPSRRPVAT